MVSVAQTVILVVHIPYIMSALDKFLKKKERKKIKGKTRECDNAQGKVHLNY